MVGTGNRSSGNVELHFGSPKGEAQNRALLCAVETQIGHPSLPSGDRLKYDRDWRDTQGWTRAYVLRHCGTPNLELGVWATDALKGLCDTIRPVLNRTLEARTL